jgi:predicted nucleic acid-binding protein
MRKELTGSMAFDTSTLLELVFSTPLGLMLKEKLLAESIVAHTSEFNIFELKYVLCRRLCREEAEKRVRALTSSGYILLHKMSRLMETAALFKCRYGIAAGDCFTLAVAKRIEGPALFARKEKEIMAELKRRNLDVEILFLEDFA